MSPAAPLDICLLAFEWSGLLKMNFEIQSEHTKVYFAFADTRILSQTTDLVLC